MIQLIRKKIVVMAILWILFKREYREGMSGLEALSYSLVVEHSNCKVKNFEIEFLWNL